MDRAPDPRAAAGKNGSRTWVRAVKSGRHDTHDSERQIVEEDLLPCGAKRIAEVFPRESVADYGDVRADTVVIIQINRPASGATPSPRKKSPETYSPLATSAPPLTMTVNLRAG